jgi:RNA polymerase sigma factor (sigma-70 family)
MDLNAAITELGWSQTRLGREVGLHPVEAHMIVRGKRRPSKALADRIQLVIGGAGIYIDPLTLWPTPDPILGETERLHCAMQIPEEPAPTDHSDLHANILTLKPIERAVLESRYVDNLTLAQTAKHLGLKCTRERVRQIQEKAISRLRHPAKLKLIEP